MNGDQAPAWLGQQAGGRMSFGLARMHGLLGLLGRPDLNIPRIVHVAGTNGKGSAARMAAAIMTAAGCRTGLYTSPAVGPASAICLIDDQPPTAADFASLVPALVDASARLEQLTGETPTPFERWTAMMYLWCAHAGVEVLVQEAGLGGRLDATNAATVTQVAVITTIDADHTDLLGTSPTAIAREKAGIIRPGMLAVTAADGEALLTVSRLAEARRVPLYVVRPGHSTRVNDVPPADPAASPGNIAGLYRVTDTATDATGTSFTCSGPGLAPLELRCPLPGRHQALNGTLAAAAALLLARFGLTRPVGRAALTAGLARATWPGRLEVWPGEPSIVLDIAHNRQGMAALVAALQEIYPGTRPVLVCGMLRDKDVVGSAAEWRQWPPRGIITASPVSERALSAATMADHFAAAGMTAQAAPSLADALEQGVALARRQSGGLLCICGSSYLVGPAREYLAGRGLCDAAGDRQC